MQNQTKPPFASIFLISAAALLLEISLIRVLTLTHSYYFALLVVSISLFGMAMGASFHYLKRFDDPLFLSSLLFSCSSIASYIVSTHIIFDPLTASYRYVHLFNLLAYYLLFSVPFFFFGLFLSHVFWKHKNHSRTIYLANLSGSAVGTLLALISISHFGHRSITSAAAIGLIASFILSKNRASRILLLCSVIIMTLPLPLSISPEKELSQALNIPGSTHLESRWNSYSRLDLVHSSYTRYAPGLSLSYQGGIPHQLGILTDASGMTALTIAGEHDYVDHLPSSVAYALRQDPKTLIINPRGGPDILAAKRYSKELTIVEYDPAIISLVQDYASFAGPIYDDTEVIHGHGRRYIQGKTFDIIIISLSGNVQARGIYGLAQDYDMTIEGMQEYYHSLSEDGYLIITRYLSFPPTETLRLYQTASLIASTREIALFRSWSTVTLVIGKRLDHGKIAEFAKNRSFDIIFMESEFTPNINAVFDHPVYYDHVNAIRRDPSFQDDYLFDIRPVHDDRPFASNYFKIVKMKERVMGKNWQPFTDPGFLMLLLFIQSIILCALFIIFPLLAKYRAPDKGMLYFLFIGISYMLVEISLMQNLVRVFGNITHAAAFVIIIMLSSSSLGSLLSGRFSEKAFFSVIIATLFSYTLFMGDIISFLVSIPASWSLLIAGVLIAVPGFFMGMPFPTGIINAEKADIPWAFAINGSASVMSSIAALFLALAFGFSAVLGIAAACYIIAFSTRRT